MFFQRTNQLTLRTNIQMKTLKASTILKAINCADNNILITDINGNIIWCNDHTLSHTGYNENEIIGKNANILKHEDTKLEIYREMWDNIKNKKTKWHGKLKNKKKDGTVYIEELTITPILDENGNIELFIGVQNDVTEIEVMKEGIKDKIRQVRELTQKQIKKQSNENI
jgi:PAS domain S-box-containing protein